MTDIPSTESQISQHETARISEAALQTAQDDLGRIVDGNGLHKTAVRISEKHLNIGDVRAEFKFRLSPDLKEERLGGRIPKGEAVENKDEANSACTDHITELYQDPNMQARMMQEVAQKDFALDSEVSIPLKDIIHQFHYFESCHRCKGEKQSRCQKCGGDGSIPCSLCRATGMIPCDHCNGTKSIVKPDGTREPCMECEGYGSRPCHICNKMKKIPCNECGSKGKISCQVCKATGEETVIQTSQYKLQMEGRLDADSGCRALLDNAKDRIGKAALIKDGHLPLSDQFKSTEIENGMVYHVFKTFPPYGDVAFSLNGKRVNSKIFGHKGLIFTDETFLDSLIKSGISALNKIAKGPLATTALFDQARNFKIIRRVTNEISRKSKKKIFADLQKDYPIGLSEKYARAIINFSDKALKKVMVKPRWMGAGIGTALGSILIYAWFHLGLRPGFLNEASLNFQLFLDGTLLGGSIVVTSYLIKLLTKATLKSVLGEAPEKLPKAGDQALVAAGVMGLAFLAAAATSASPPLWWSQFF